ncbi:glycosyltransferase family 2 protein [Tilletiaria anomala UBC 951]|uniref:Glycosyltransferase family 2 protein n=1 Tax=Tilletiaria anomala (strain ATCC 24038 / CBS 436.72 / UBC 951) TaxID=1037660 RepID=A0A066VLR8_TILAU|nr:glycosyltransferase family 2 protein [Tilletiaria anomala UBC 951]KDN42401.1 glycosyltransferase family 2 protein [Tilletiaria anomala UBC 951]
MLYLTADKFPVFVPFGVIGFYRYFWYLIRLAAALVYRPIPPPLNPTYIASEDVTIIVPTIDAGEEFKEAAYSWLESKPAQIIIVTEAKMKGPLQELANQVDPSRITVLTVPKANKRLQMSHGIRNTMTDIIVFADDDAIWPPTMLEWILACFEDQQVGGVGTSQRVKPIGNRMTVWETLAAFRLSIRNFEIASSTHIDGGVPCLSGRTAAYRTVILKDPAFLHGFTNDYWLGKYLLNSGDDKFLTRWLVSHGWNTYIQVCPEVELLSTMKPDARFLKQVLRWTRNTWRSDIRSIFKERYIWTRHPYVAYCMIDKFINPLTLLVGPCLVGYLLYKSTKSVEDGGYHLPAWRIVVSYLVWLTATRTLKLLPHLWFRPQDIIYVPAYIAFGYFFALLKIYALFTLHETGWGTRVGVGLPEDANAADQDAQNAYGYESKESPFNDKHAAAYGATVASATPSTLSTPLRAPDAVSISQRRTSYSYATPSHAINERRQAENVEMHSLPR